MKELKKNSVIYKNDTKVKVMKGHQEFIILYQGLDIAKCTNNQEKK